MKYYIIAGEASGDLHASNLIRALHVQDAEASVRGIGGDLMAGAGCQLVHHYRDMAYMGFIPVLLHLRTIFRRMAECKRDIVDWAPDVVILVDYPGFNLKIAEYVKAHTRIPVFYYISPKIWAWKEYRIRNIRRDVDELFSILPFEREFFSGHHYPIHYVGNPCVDAVRLYQRENPSPSLPLQDDKRPIIALLAGSRKQEIKDNLSRMIAAVEPYRATHQIVIAGAPGIPPSFYKPYLKDSVRLVEGQTYALLSRADVALVTSGTATLETALFRVPQVVCYYTAAGKLVSFLRRHILKVKFISLVNLVAGKEVVTELVADGMTVPRLQQELARIIEPQGEGRQKMLTGYDEMIRILGPEGASERAAQEMVKIIKGSLRSKISR
jgi:lipid-A-disaccharide synthase